GVQGEGGRSITSGQVVDERPDTRGLGAAAHRRSSRCAAGGRFWILSGAFGAVDGLPGPPLVRCPGLSARGSRNTPTPESTVDTFVTGPFSKSMITIRAVTWLIAGRCTEV